MTRTTRPGTTRWSRRRAVRWPAAAVVIAVMATMLALSGSSSAEAQGYISDDVGIGYFYGTFNESPNIVLLAGGTVEEFCEAGPEGDAGSAPGRIFLRNDGTVDVKVNDKDQPIYLYEVDFPGAVPWLQTVCPLYFAGEGAPQAFASGLADVKVRVTEISPGNLEIFNSVNGKATGTDGAEYKVRGSADFVLEDGVQTTNPEDFVSFTLNRLGN